MALPFLKGTPDNSTIADLTKMAEQSRSLRSSFEPNWFLNLAFYLGDQWCFWNRGRLDRPRLPAHRLLLVDNRIMPSVMSRVAKKTKQRPIWTVTPNSPDDQDVAAAQLGELIVEDYWKTLKMQEKLFEVLLWADICGAGFWKMYWDKTLGESNEFVVDQNGQAMLDQMGRPIRAQGIPPQMLQQFQTKTLAQGNVCLEVRSPFMILPDPLANSLEECEWIIEETVQSPQYVKDHFGVEMQGDTPASGGPTDSRYFPSMAGAGGSSYMGVKVYEFWAKPGSKWGSKGKYVAWAKGKELYSDDNKYDCLPYFQFTGVPVPGRFWPTSITEQLRGPQIELNKVRSQIAENGQRIGNPSILKDRLANVEYSGVPGEEILYDSTTPNSVPQFLQPPEMPVYVREQLQTIQQSMQEISGQHEVSSSQVPAGVTAASAINLLLEQDDTRMGPAILDMETQLSASGQMLLKMIAQYCSEERTMQFAGEDGDYDFVGFKGEMLRNNINIEVQAGSMTPVSKAAKQAGIRDTLTLFIQNGMPLDPRTLRKMVRDLEVGDIEGLFGNITTDIRQVKRENRFMYAGQPIPINTYDNDDLHIAEHQDEMKSARYFRQPQQVKAIFEAHVALHMNRRASAQEAAAQSQMQGQMQQDQMQQQASIQAQDQQHQQAMTQALLQGHIDMGKQMQQHSNSMQQQKAQPRPQQGRS